MNNWPPYPLLIVKGDKKGQRSEKLFFFFFFLEFYLSWVKYKLAIGHFSLQPRTFTLRQSGKSS